MLDTDGFSTFDWSVTNKASSLSKKYLSAKLSLPQIQITLNLPRTTSSSHTSMFAIVNV
jgi:hypothetical protein